MAVAGGEKTDEASSLVVARFYRFMKWPEFATHRAAIRELGAALGLKGTVLLAPEGINATIAGAATDVQRFVAELEDHIGVASFSPGFSETSMMPFRRWRVRLKKEIVTMKAAEADPLQRVGEYVSPENWNAVVQDPSVLLIDVRNAYEIERGAFRNAVNPNTADFWEFPSFVDQHLIDKERPVAMYCTGGIRCEKASAFLLAHGFRKVMHLKGGILAYLEQVPSDESTFEGACFVFDDRDVVNPEPPTSV
jgi:UPF0176 protein